jgi:hypothetical protein
VNGLRAYAAGSARVARRSRLRGFLGPHEERLVFVVGCPRSGTTFTGSALGRLPGFVDMDEVTPLKAALPRLALLPEVDAAGELRAIVERVRLLGLARGLRGVEQTPETSFVLAAALQAYPAASALHVLRDGRDVVCSLLERGWFRGGRGGADDAGLAYGAHARFWVEPERAEEFARASDARRCAWAWRRYVSAVRSVRDERVLEVRYENLRDSAAPVAAHLELARPSLERSLARTFTTSVGRWRRELSAEQLADVETEAGELLAALGYGNAGAV